MPVVREQRRMVPGEFGYGYESTTEPGRGLFALEYRHQERRWVDPLKPPRTLWHYTGPAGLLGIVRERELRGSQLGYQNDEQEHVLGVTMAIEMLKADMGTWPPGAAEDVLKALEDPWQIQPLRRYVICFAGPSRGDNLSHWRGYAGDGGGYSLGFHGGKLQSYAARCGWDLGRCVYDEKDQKLLIGEALDNAKTDHEFQATQAVLIPPDGRIIGLDPLWTNWAAIVKHRGFADEHEWRLFTRPTTQPEPLFRSGKHNLVPYTRLEPQILDGKPEILSGEPKMGFLLDALRTIIVGPGPSADRAYRACEAFVSRYAKHVKVRHSVVPYRDW